MDYLIALAVDIFLVVASLWCILNASERSIFNPSLWWVALHVYTVTFRLIALSLGSQSMWYIGIQSDMELVHAAIASDISLLAVVAATIFAARRTHRDRVSVSEDSSWTRLSPRVGQVISLLCLTIGTIALFMFGYYATAARARGIDVSAINLGQLETSAYPITIAAFGIQGALIQCAMRGFNRWTVSLFLILLFLTAFNLARNSSVLAILMAFMIYQTRRRQHWLRLRWAIGIAILGLMWFVFKPIATGVTQGKNAEEIRADVRNYLEKSRDESSSIDTQFLDMQATYMAAADQANRRFYGATVLPLLYLPIPRFVWPEKPPVNEAGSELTTASRLISVVGLPATLSGESYINFGWIGCAVIPFLYILGMQMAYRRVRSHDITSAARWIYLIYLMVMIVVFRDGLSLLIIFPLVYYLPLFSWGAISMLLPADRVCVKIKAFRLPK
jgi:hypothetical protein